MDTLEIINKNANCSLRTENIKYLKFLRKNINDILKNLEIIDFCDDDIIDVINDESIREEIAKEIGDGISDVYAYNDFLEMHEGFTSFMEERLNDIKKLLDNIPNYNMYVTQTYNHNHYNIFQYKINDEIKLFEMCDRFLYIKTENIYLNHNMSDLEDSEISKSEISKLRTLIKYYNAYINIKNICNKINTDITDGHKFLKMLKPDIDDHKFLKMLKNIR